MHELLKILVVILICTTGSNAQQIKKWNSNYKVGDTEYTKQELLEYLEKDSTAHALFSKGFKHQKAANIAGLLTIGLGGGGILVGSIASSQSGCDHCSGLFIGAGLILASAIPGTIGIGKQIAATKNKRSALRYYNEKYGAKNSEQESSTIQFGIQPSGVGWVYNF